jgi:hypothetical protein
MPEKPAARPGIVWVRASDLLSTGRIAGREPGCLDDQCCGVRLLDEEEAAERIDNGFEPRRTPSA